ARRGGQDADRRRGLAAHQPAERRVPGERSPGCVGAGGCIAADAEGAGEGQRSGACRGRGDRARDVHAGQADRARCPGERAVRAGGGGAAGVQVRAPVLALGLGIGAASSAWAGQSPLERVMHRKTLDNGMQVIVVENTAVPLATALVAVHNGAFTQDTDEAGLAHLYEHLLFHSFRHNPSAFGLEATKLKGVYNGTTSDEVVNYFVTVPSDNIESAIGLLADLLLKAGFSNGDLKAERSVVLNELQRGESDPEGDLERQVERALWGAAWHRKDVGGDSSSLQGISLDRLKATYARYYVPNNAALIVTGDVEPDRNRPIENRRKTTTADAQQAILAIVVELQQLDLLHDGADDDLAIARKRRQVGTALTLERTASLAPSLAFWWSAAGMDYYLGY